MGERHAGQPQRLESAELGSEEVWRQYDEWAKYHDETLRFWDSPARKEAAALLKPRLRADAAIFDAGCGTGL